MNYITTFDIRLSKDIYYSGDILLGSVVLGIHKIFLSKKFSLIKLLLVLLKSSDIHVILRGKARTHIKLNRTGEPHIRHDKQYILNEKLVIWDKKNCDEKEDEPILFSGLHNFPFQFELPQSSLPCSLETKLGTIRYYVKVIINIPHDTIPQGIKYFTIIGPSINCMDEKYCVTWHGCCRRGALALRVIMDRTAYLCGENVRILAHVENRQSGVVWIAMRLIQHVEYFVEKNAEENKQIDCVVLESKTLPVQPYTQGKFDTAQLQSFIIPVVPPTLVGVCRLLQIFYVFQACIEDEEGNQTLQMEFPLTIATLPFLKATMPTPMLDYDICCAHVEGGRYISSEFRIDSTDDDKEDLEQSVDDHIILYRPLYVCIAQQQPSPNCHNIDTQHHGHRKSISMVSGNISQLNIPETGQYLEEDEKSDDIKNPRYQLIIPPVLHTKLQLKDSVSPEKISASD